MNGMHSEDNNNGILFTPTTYWWYSLLNPKSEFTLHNLKIFPRNMGEFRVESQLNKKYNLEYGIPYALIEWVFCQQ